MIGKKRLNYLVEKFIFYHSQYNLIWRRPINKDAEDIDNESNNAVGVVAVNVLVAASIQYSRV